MATVLPIAAATIPHLTNAQQTNYVFNKPIKPELGHSTNTMKSVDIIRTYCLCKPHKLGKTPNKRGRGSQCFKGGRN